MNMIETLKPWLRYFKYQWLQYSAEYKAQNSKSDQQINNLIMPVFLIGCGRSGTTILGNILSLHPEICYFFEPYHLWAAIDPLTDVLNLYHRINAHLVMNKSHCNDESIIRFERLFFGNSYNKDIKVLTEKTPLNSMRIGYLNALAPKARFIHIVRDGVNVSCSIERIASTNSYKIAGKSQLNQWWGIDNYKWKALSREGASAGYYCDQVSLLQDHRSKGAYEWLVSLGEVERWRQQLGDHLYEIRYEQLTANPEDELRSICKFLELDSPSSWLDKTKNMIKHTNCNSGEIISLPPAMCKTFNRYQERFGFNNRAIPWTSIDS